VVNGADLSLEALAALMPGRAVRSYPALLSTHADALAWARAGAPAGAIVVAEYQASPRGRAGLEWRIEPGTSLAFSLILMPALPPEREGWLYTVSSLALANVLGPDVGIEWPDEVWRRDERLGAVGVEVQLGPELTDWAVVSVLVSHSPHPRGPLLAKIAEGVEAKASALQEEVLAEHLARCRTIGRRVRARLIPMGPTGIVISGTATGTKLDGALLIETVKGSHVAVRPQNLGVLEHVQSEPDTDYPEAVRAYLARRNEESEKGG
jgi:BirA family biotin operon repressor/biotin-[acetyl-CoA-carboxylase] ligase